MPPAQPPLVSLMPILIAGATASGKSALAVRIAAEVGGLVINADSMQVYAELPILTAQPTTAERAGVPHALYGHVPAREAYSTGRYLQDVAQALAEARSKGLRPVIVGGTGLYFKALLEGLSPVPPIPDNIRAAWRARAAIVPADVLWQDLAARDPAMAQRLAPSDAQRIVRALEVYDATGQSLSAWWQQAGAPLIAAGHAVKLVVARTRTDLHARCDVRFDAMMAAGALDEVGALARLDLAADLPAMRALGVRPLMAHLAGTCSLADAVAQAKLETRQYVKRQQTWLRRQMADWQPVAPEVVEFDRPIFERT